MRKKLTHNLSLKVLSAVFAIILWLVVVNTIDPVMEKPISNIPVEILNEYAITSEGKVYDILEGSDTITVTVRANRSIIEDLRATDFVATADMKEMVVANSVPINVTCSKYSSYIESIEPKTKTVKISIEDSATKQFAINVTTIGTPADGYAVGDSTCSPSVLKVSGPASVVNKISRVSVEADVTDMSTYYSNTLSPKFYDSDGDVIDSSRLSYRSSEVSVSVTMLKTKNISLSFGITGEPAQGYGFVETVCSPDTVTIAGTAANLAKVTSIAIEDNEVDIADATANVQKMVDISGYLPDGIKLVDADEGSVLVTAIIEKLKTKSFEIASDNIELVNIPEGYSGTLSVEDEVVIAVKGLEEVVNSLTVEDIRVTVDLSSISSVGVKTLPITVELPGDLDLEIVGDITVNVVVTYDRTGTASTNGRTASND